MTAGWRVRKFGPPRQRIHRLAKDAGWNASLADASKFSPEYKSALAAWFAALTGLSTTDILAALEAGEVGLITASIWDAAGASVGADDLDKELEDKLRAVTESMCEAAGVSQWDTLGFSASFTLNNPYSEEWIPAHAAELVTGVSGATKEAIAAEVLAGFEAGYPPAVMAQRVKEMIGLLPSQVSSLRAYEANLRAAGYSEAMIRARLEQRRSRLLTERAEMITRTETINAHAEGTLASWREARDRGLFPVGVRKIWIATPGSDRTCPICLSLHDAVIDLDGDFSGNYQMTPTSAVRTVTARAPTAHPRCRCTMALRYLT